jgi:hypothetical protein
MEGIACPSPDLRAQYDQLTERMWETMDLLHAIQIGRSAVANAIQEASRGTQE